MAQRYNIFLMCKKKLIFFYQNMIFQKITSIFAENYSKQQLTLLMIWQLLHYSSTRAILSQEKHWIT